MDLYIKITKKFTKKFGCKVINRKYFHRKTGLKLGGVNNYCKYVVNTLTILYHDCLLSDSA